MTVTYGFYNSVAGDRVYDAIQVSQFFDGILVDGIYENIGNSMMVTEYLNMVVRVGVGRSWFKHSWTYNDALLNVTIATAHPTLNRIDVVYIRMNQTSGVRANSIGVLTGTPSSDPVPPTLATGPDIWEYALANILVKAGVTSIAQEDITNKVGTVDTPYVESGIYSPVAPGSVGPTELATDAVTAGKIADGAINDGFLFTTGVVPGGAIALSAIGSNHLQASSVIAGKIAVGAVNGSAILADAVVTNPKLRDSVGLSVIGRSGNSTGDVADISAANDGQVLRRSGTTLGFGQLSLLAFPDNLITGAKLLDETITPVKIANRTRQIFVPASHMWPATVYPATLEKFTFGTAMAFDNAATEECSTGFMVPSDYVSGTLNFYLVWTKSAAGSGDVAWVIGESVAGDGEVLPGQNPVVGSVYAVPAGIYEIEVDLLASFTVSVGDFIMVNIFRFGSDPSDGYTGRALLIGAYLSYLADS